MLKKFSLFAFLAFCLLSQAGASIQIMTTRVILEAQKKEQTVRINNVGNNPSLLQLWISTSSDTDGQVKEDLPFFINPPAARVNAQKGKVFRLFQTDEAVNKYPKDRETMLWLNVLDIPPDMPEDTGNNQLNMAFRTIIKFFYRPAGLKGDPMQAADDLKWEIKRTVNGFDVVCTNASAFHVSMTRLWLIDAQGKEHDIAGDTVKPFDKKSFHFAGVKEIQGKGIVKYNYITDLGAYIKRTHEL